MEVLFHFILELFKIAILASIYAGLFLLITRFIASKKPNSLFSNIHKHKIRSWLISGALFSVFLFSFLFSYWGNHGLGDTSIIPLGHGKTVQQIDGNWCFINAKGYEMEKLTIGNFAYNNEFLFAEVLSNPLNNDSADIVVWNLKSDALVFLKDLAALNQFKTEHGIERELLFLNFQKHYNKYWNTWRFFVFA